ncbi:GIN domain-containing protein [Marinimicrobium sp. ABcell2]|uniref:GIN domain-containing protein n=1 Tax=Marinimicrobium sp. ABcell2 TaxID=3069751 RepID=UPI0027B24C5C|nr:DUF2807 domain-containing protein [Marinimicrobium sp. ABcell2]MDQ2077019.1 DUF2807 domain-containing protein [Marinimicrobium sp. ABcell2]
MKIRSLLIICLCLLAPTSAVAEELSQSYAIENIRYIEVGHAARIEIQQGATESLQALGTADVLERVTVDVKGDRLILGVRRKTGRLFNWFGSDDDIKFVVQVQELSGLQLRGAAHAAVGALQGQSLSLDASGASQIQFERLEYEQLALELSGATQAVVNDAHLKRLTLSASGASKVELKGASTLDELSIDLSGASKYFGRGLDAIQARIKASGASNADIGVIESLEVRASGASSVHYAGRPQIKQHTSGASNINSRED